MLRHFLILSSIILFLLNSGYSQAPIFVSLKTNQLGWGKFTFISSVNAENIISKHISINQKAKGIPGYRVQVYFTSGTDAKNQINKMKTELRNSFPEYDCYIIYEEPFFKLRMGDFRTKIEAYKLFCKIKDVYPSAFIVEDLIAFPSL
ncbi:MAG: SPOR domain-containing protein [Bacteroidales bacterium]|nr:SPOR domain-containing protein [Bacteroidales bacterium]